MVPERCFEVYEQLKTIIFPNTVNWSSILQKQFQIIWIWCDFFYNDNIEELIIRSNLKDVTYSIVYMLMHKIIEWNPRLLEKKCMNYKLYQIDVANEKLVWSYHGEDKPHELIITKTNQMN